MEWKEEIEPGGETVLDKSFGILRVRAHRYGLVLLSNCDQMRLLDFCVFGVDSPIEFLARHGLVSHMRDILAAARSMDQTRKAA